MLNRCKGSEFPEMLICLLQHNGSILVRSWTIVSRKCEAEIDPIIQSINYTIEEFLEHQFCLSILLVVLDNSKSCDINHVWIIDVDRARLDWSFGLIWGQWDKQNNKDKKNELKSHDVCVVIVIFLTFADRLCGIE